MVPGDLSVCSEDFYEMDIPEEPSSQKIVPTEIPSYVDLFLWSIEVQFPVLKGQYDVTDNQFTWVGVVGTEINMKCSGEWEVVILSSGRQVNSVILLLFLLKVIRVSPILATIMDTLDSKQRFRNVFMSVM